jgi:hypothetical protein
MTHSVDSLVIAGLDPAIHPEASACFSGGCPDRVRSSPGMTDKGMFLFASMH